MGPKTEALILIVVIMVASVIGMPVSVFLFMMIGELIQRLRGVEGPLDTDPILWLGMLIGVVVGILVLGLGILMSVKIWNKAMKS